MLKILLSTTLLYSFIFALDKVDSIQSIKNQFVQYQSSQAIDFKNYERMHLDAIKQYKKDLSTLWDEPTLTSKNTIVSYAKDKKTRTNIDFKNEEIIIQTLAKTPQEATLKLKLALAKAVTIDTKSLFDNDPLQKKLTSIRKKNKMDTLSVNAKAILSPVIFSKPPTKKNVRVYVDKHIKYKNIKVSKSKKVKHSRIYTTRVKMPNNTIIKRSKIYYQTIKTESRRQNIPMPLIFAVIHSESSFNPLAKSHVPAFGLMQIVPRSAGRDAYKYLYNKKRLVSGSYLYNSKNNIKMGTAYLHILYYKYLKYIKNEDSKLYCTIAAYNTGAGNVAWAFTKNNDIKSAAKIINAMDSKAVYNYLIKNLKYDEPKFYLQKVISRMPIYNRLYGV